MNPKNIPGCLEEQKRLWHPTNSYLLFRISEMEIYFFLSETVLILYMNLVWVQKHSKATAGRFVNTHNFMSSTLWMSAIWPLIVNTYIISITGEIWRMGRTLTSNIHDIKNTCDILPNTTGLNNVGWWFKRVATSLQPPWFNVLLNLCSLGRSMEYGSYSDSQCWWQTE